MSLEWAIRTLKKLGLTEQDAMVYIFLAKKGPHYQDELGFTIDVTEPQLCESLDTLVSKRMVQVVAENQIRYSAVALDEVLDGIVAQTRQQARALQTRKTEILAAWHSIIKDEQGST